MRYVSDPHMNSAIAEIILQEIHLDNMYIYRKFGENSFDEQFLIIF